MNSDKDVRLVSQEILNSIFINGKNLKNEFEKKASFLNNKEASFIKFLVYGIVRYKKSIDHAL